LRGGLEHPEDDSLAILRDMPRPGEWAGMRFLGGLGDGRGPARFPFLAWSGPYDVDRVFVRDVDELWYQRGAGTGSVDDLANELALTLRDRVGDVTMFGNSSGGVCLAARCKGCPRVAPADVPRLSTAALASGLSLA
jgi:hypothetical protein